MIQLTEEQDMIRKTVRKLAEEKLAPIAVRIDKAGEFSRDVVELFEEYDLLRLKLPKKYGGLETDHTTYYLVIEEIARVCASSSMLVATQGSCLTSLLVSVNKEQEERFFGRLGKGNVIMSWALTEPGAGSDVGSMRTRAVLNGDHYIINGSKCFITAGGVADIYTTFVRTGSGQGTKGLSGFVVEKDTPGFNIGKIEDKLGMRGSQTTELIFEDARVSKENLLGREGGGWSILMESIKETRLGIASQALGIAQGALDYATRYSKERVQFGRPISENQGIQFMLADMKIQVEASRALIYQTASMLDRGIRDILPYAAMAKCMASDTAMRVTTDAVQILGGYGYMKDHPVERMMRDAKSTQITEGTNQIQRMIIARSMLK
ncbi:MAG: acyl-CoA dehydrogenase [Deltaproteobacteria bacterium CG2_30_43_15]|nr:MAG: acyl-CoA dehydrogenase [Deltaproteobacteria bacterium CG2_30_43_15]